MHWTPPSEQHMCSSGPKGRKFSWHPAHCWSSVRPSAVRCAGKAPLQQEMLILMIVNCKPASFTLFWMSLNWSLLCGVHQFINNICSQITSIVHGWKQLSRCGHVDINSCICLFSSLSPAGEWNHTPATRPITAALRSFGVYMCLNNPFYFYHHISSYCKSQTLFVTHVSPLVFFLSAGWCVQTLSPNPMAFPESVRTGRLPCWPK